MGLTIVGFPHRSIIQVNSDVQRMSKCGRSEMPVAATEVQDRALQRAQLIEQPAFNSPDERPEGRHLA